VPAFIYLGPAFGDLPSNTEFENLLKQHVVKKDVFNIFGGTFRSHAAWVKDVISISVTDSGELQVSERITIFNENEEPIEFNYEASSEVSSGVKRVLDFADLSFVGIGMIAVAERIELALNVFVVNGMEPIERPVGDGLVSRFEIEFKDFDIDENIVQLEKFAHLATACLGGTSS